MILSPTRSLALARALCLAAALALPGAASARFLPVRPLPPVAAIPVEAPDADRVGLLLGLAKTERDLQLGLLFLFDKATGPAATHLSRPRAEHWPAIAGGILAAGGPDLEPLLARMETAGDAAGMNAAYAEVSMGLAKARAALAPSRTEMIAAIAEQSRGIAEGLSAAGATTPQRYQEAWAMLMVTRNQVDLLSRDADPAVAAAAGGMAAALDDVILAIPDPIRAAPAPVDAGPIIEAVTALEAAGSST